MSNWTVAGVQMGCTLGDLVANRVAVVANLRRAADRGAKLVVFPECILSGYGFDSREQARLESGDLIEPVAQGLLDWLEVHELQDVVAGELNGRESDEDVVVFKSNGIAAWDVVLAAELLERALEHGVGRAL